MRNRTTTASQRISSILRRVNIRLVLPFSILITICLVTFRRSSPSFNRLETSENSFLPSHPQETSVPTNEFKLPTNESWGRHGITFDVSEPSSDYGHDIVQPMWSCRRLINRQKKFVFVHIFKAGGSFIRTLLLTYNHHCRANLAIIVSCTSLTFESMDRQSMHWTNEEGGRRDGAPCRLKKAKESDTINLPIPQNATVNSKYLHDNNLDILAGHLPFGSHDQWLDSNGQNVDALSLVFFRDALSKFVSGILFRDKGKSTFKDIIARIRERVTTARNDGTYYEKYSSYLITPRQVERMSESLEMIHHVLDMDDELRPLFEVLGMNNQNGTSGAKPVLVNKSRHSTREILAELEKDPPFMELLREYVKYDDQVYRFAVQLHERQYEAMLKYSKTMSPVVQ